MNLIYHFITVALLLTKPSSSYRKIRSSIGRQLKVHSSADNQLKLTESISARSHGSEKLNKRHMESFWPKWFSRRRQKVAHGDPGDNQRRGLANAPPPKAARERHNQHPQRLKRTGATRVNRPSLLDAAQHVYSKYFKFPYPPAPHNASAAVAEVWYTRRWKARCNVERPNHGLPNAVRKAVLIPVVIEAYRRFYVGRWRRRKRPRRRKDYGAWLSKESFNFSSEMVTALQIAIMFEATGRQSEIGFGDDWHLYESFRLGSLEAFSSYAKPLLEEAVYNIAYDAFSRMYMSPRTKASYPAQIILQKAHDLELLRCWEFDRVFKKLREMMKDLGDDVVAANVTMSLATYVENMLVATGDNIQYCPSNGTRKWWQCKIFNDNGNNASRCLGEVRKVVLPAIPPEEARRNYNSGTPAALALPLPPSRRNDNSGTPATLALPALPLPPSSATR